jgi:hypothetical protein
MPLTVEDGLEEDDPSRHDNIYVRDAYGPNQTGFFRIVSITGNQVTVENLP